MVAIVSGNGLGVSLSSLATLGGKASSGAATQGRNGELAFVNIANGNLILQDHDAVQSELGAIPLDSLRVYNSQGTVDATDNWSNGFSMQRLVLTGTVNTAGSTIVRTDTDGAQATYNFYSGVYATAQGGGAYDSIVYDTASAQYTRVDSSTGAQEKYNASGRLVLLQDANYNPLTFTYGATGLVTSVADAAGATRTYYDYNASNQLTQIRTLSVANATSTLVRYTYDAAGRLATVVVDLSPADNSIADGKTFTTTYAYVGSTKQLQSVTQSDGSSLTFGYVANDPTFKLQSVTDAIGNKTSFSYDAANRKTTVTDANGQASVCAYDAAGQLLSVAVPSAAGTATTSYVYNTNGDLTQLTDPSGRTIVMAYDVNGNQISQVDSAGNTVTRTFDNNKQLLTETAYVVPDPDGAGATPASQPVTTRYVYDASGWDELRFVLSPEGRVTQYVYNDYNERIATIQYASSAYAVAGLAATAVPTEAQMVAWVATQDLTKSVRTDVAYNAIGMPTQSVTYAKVDASGNGVIDGTQSTTTYVYDQYGHLLQQVKPGTGATNFTYDGLGRILTTQDANGTATNVYDDANGKTVATAVNGLITTSTYDKAGRLVSVVQGTSSVPNLGTITNAYDADGHLLMTTDPDGNRTFALYDAAGRQVAAIDATGLLTERVYNLAGQRVETLRYATAANLALLVDGTGKALNPALSAVRPTGTSYVSWTLYDTAGRVSKQVDPAGYVTETRYDGASRVTDVVRYANAVTVSGISTTTLATAVAPTADAVNDRLSRAFYDNDGNVAGALDAEGYLTENVYDSAGRLVHAIRYATATASANRASGTLATLRPAADNIHDIHAWNYYNDENQLVGSVDGEGYLTEYACDVDGHVIKTTRHAALALVAPTAILATTTLAALRPTVTTGDRVTQSSYNSLGQFVSTINPEGTITQYTYDTAGNVLTTTVAATTTDARTETRKYDIQGHLLSDLGGVGSAALAALGATPTPAQIAAVWTTYATNYTYDADGLRTSTTDAAGNKTLYYYDVDGRATHTVNALGEVAETSYNVLGQVVATTRIGTRLTSTVLATLTGGIDTAALLSAITTAKNATLDSKVTYTYLAQGVVGTRTDELGDLTTYLYNAFGQSTQATQAIGSGANVVHKVDYDRRGLVKATQENSADELTTFAYDAFGRAVSATDPKGNLTSTTFDRLGRTTLVTGPLFVSSQATFDAFGRTLIVKDANGNATSYVYDDLARTMKVTDLYNVTVTRTHDREGETIAILDGDGNTTTYAYDADGHLKDTITDPGSGHLALDSHTDYDAAGRIADTVDASGNKVTYTYNAANRVFKRTEGANASMNIVTTYTYDPKGQLITQQDPDGVLTGITYDLGGHLLTRTVDTAGLQLKTTNTYDVRGNLLTSTDPSGVVTTYAYNAIGRRISQQVDTTLKLTTQYGYDGDGNLTRQIDPDGNVTLNAYDKAGRLIYSQDGANNVTGYTYDNDGHVLTSTRYAKVQASLVAAVTANGTVNITVTVPTLTAGQDQTTTTTYDTNGRKTLAEVDKAGLDLKTQYFYDGSGNVTKIVDPNGAATLYIYDAANRVTSTLSPAGTLTQTAYDGDGHVAQTTVYSGVKAMTTTVATNGRVTNAIAGTLTTSPNDLVTSYTYDAANRRKTATVDPNGLALKTQYAYDPAGNLTQVTDPAGKITYYGYDAAGRQRYVLDAQNLLTETVYDGASRVTATIVYGTVQASPSATPNAAGLVTPVFTVVGSVTLDRVTRYAYDAAGHQLYAVDAMGAVTETAYDAAGLVTGVRRYATPITLPAAGAADGRTLAMTTAAIKAAISTNAADLSTSYAYDAAGRKVFSVDAYGSVTGYTYDAFNQLAIKRQYATTVAQPTWGTAFTAAAITTALGAANPADRLTRLGYDNAGRTLYSVDPLGVVTASAYDPDSRVIKTQVYHAAIVLPTDGSALTGAAIAAKLAASAATDAVTRYAYDADGHPVFAVDAMGFVTATTYDPQGRARAKTVYATPATLPTTQGATMTAADITAALHPDPATDQVTRYVVDDAGRVTFSIDPLGHVVAYTYDKDGNVAQKTAYSKAIVNSTLALVVNASDFSVTATPATDRTTRYFYDGDNRLRFEIDPLGFATETNYQADRTVTTQYAVTPTVTGTAVTADVATAVAAIANATNDHKTTVLEDRDGRSTDTTTPDGVIARDTYDAFGRVLTHVDAVGLPEQLTTGYVYDGAGRVKSKTVGQGSTAAQTTTTSYNAFGNVDTVVSPDGYALANLDTAWAQAERARLGMPAASASLTPAQRTELLARYTTKFNYDLDGRALTTTTSYLSSTATSTSTSTKYDAFGNAVKVVDPLGNAGYFYFDKLGRVVMQGDPLLNVVQTTYTGGFSDKVATVRRYANKAPASTNESAAPTPATSALDVVTTYTYDKLGRVLSTVNASGTTDQSTESVAWPDATGNIFNKVVTNKLGGATTYVYDRDGQELSETLPVTSRKADSTSLAVTNSYTYDAFGNRTQSIEGVGLPEQRTTLYKYDAMGRVIYRIGTAYSAVVAATNTTTTVTPVDRTIYDALGRVVETQANANWNGTTATGGVRSLTYYDAAGNATMTIDANGAVVSNRFTTSGKLWTQSRMANPIALPATGAAAPALPTADVLNDRTKSYVYDSLDRLVETDQINLVYWEAHLDGTGNLITSLNGVQPAAQAIALQKLSYDLNGNVTQQSDAYGNSVYSYYDALGRMTLSIDGGGYATAWDYGDVFDTATQQIQYSTQVASGSYVGQPLSAAQAATLRTWLDGQTPAATSPNRITTSLLDRQGRVHEHRVKNVAFDYVAADGTRSTHTSDSVTDFTYNGLGDITEQSDRVAELSDNLTNVWNITDYTYDKLGRRVEELDPTYVDFTGASVRTTRDTEYDGLGNVHRTLQRGTVSGTETDDHITLSTYDANGNLASQTDANLNVTTYEYDVLGRVSRTTVLNVLDADGGHRNVVKLFQYDAMGRQTIQTDLGTGEVRNTKYNAFGDITDKGLGAGAFQEHSAYNVMGKVERTNSGDGAWKLYLYDLNGNATRKMVSNTLDLSSLSVVAAATAGTLTTYSIYDARNNLVKTVEPSIQYTQNAVSESAAYAYGLTDPYGAITVAQPAGTQSLSGSGYGQTAVGGANTGLQFALGAGPGLDVMAGRTFAPVTAAAPVAIVGTSFALGDSRTTPGATPDTRGTWIMPTTFPDGSYRVVNGTWIDAYSKGGGVIPTLKLIAGTSQVQYLFGTAWVTVSSINNVQKMLTHPGGGEMHGTNAMTATDAYGLVLTPPSGVSVVAYVNYGTYAQQALALSVVTSGVWGVTVPTGATSVHVESFDMNGVRLYASDYSVSTGTYLNGTAYTACNSYQASSGDVWASWISGGRGLTFNAGATGSNSGSLWVRQSGTQNNWTQYAVSQDRINLATLPDNLPYEFIYQASNGKETYGTFSTQVGSLTVGNGGALTQVTEPANAITLHPAVPYPYTVPGSSIVPATYTVSFNIGGHVINRTVAAANIGQPITLSASDLVAAGVGISNFTNQAPGYVYTIYADRSGYQEVVVSGAGSLTLGSDPSTSPTAVTLPFAYLPIGVVHLPVNVAGGSIVLTPPGSGPVTFAVNGDSHAFQGAVATDLNINLGQWLAAGTTGDFAFSYTVGNVVYKTTISLAASGLVSVGNMTATTMQASILLNLPGASSIQIFQGTDPNSMTPASNFSGGGGSFNWNVVDIASATQTRYFRYQGLNAAGQIISRGHGSFVLDGSGAMTVPTVVDWAPQFVFTPPTGTQNFSVIVDGSPVALTNSGSSYLFIPPPGFTGTHDCTYTGTDVNGILVTSGKGQITVDAQGVCTNTLKTNYKVLTFQGPQGYNIAGGQLRIVLQGKTAADPSGTVTVPGVWNTGLNSMVFTWDVDGTGFQKAGETHAHNTTMTLLNSDSSLAKTPLGDSIVVNGSITLGASSTQAPVVQQTVQYLAQAAQVRHMQTWNAFGQISEEYDDVTAANALAMEAHYGEAADTSAVKTTFVYNTLGQLTLKTDPQTDIVAENGYRTRARPQTAYGYDLEGRLVSTTDANGAVTLQNYAGGSSAVSTHWNAVNAGKPTLGDGGSTLTQYDIFGAERRTTQSIDATHTEVIEHTTDNMGNLVTSTQKTVSRTAADGTVTTSDLVDSYTYDALAHRITHTNTLRGTNTDKTYYDNLGRVTKTISAFAFVTRYDYTFFAAGASSKFIGPGTTNPGGYELRTTNADGTAMVDDIDYFDQTTAHTDEGGRTYTYTYNIGGHLVLQKSSGGQNITYQYADNGDLLASIDLGMGTMSQYGYDNAGNRVSEAYGALSADKQHIALAWEAANIQYDELGRMAIVADASANVQYQYDGVGNRRSVQAIYFDSTSGLRQQDNFWYQYDASNRFLMTKGSLSGHATSATDTSASIVQGSQGIKISYDQRGDRLSALNADGTQETYTYSTDGFLVDALVGSTQVLRARRVLDSLGRTAEYMEWAVTGPHTLTTDQKSTYDADSRLVEMTDTVKNTVTDYYFFVEGNARLDSGATQIGAGAVAHVTTKPVGGSVIGTTTFTYDNWDSAKETGITASGSTGTGSSTLAYDLNGYLQTVQDASTARTLTYVNNANGLVMQRAQTADNKGGTASQHFYYYAAGRMIGDVSTDHNENLASRASYAEVLAQTTPGGKEDPSRYKKVVPANSKTSSDGAVADFDQNYQPINATYPAATSQNYTVRTGDTLRSVAQATWGDADMWYLIAQANNLTGNETLVQGQILQIPNKVTNIHNNATTFRPYNPGEAIGDINPSLPDPPPPAHPGKGCGTIGTIIMVVVAVVATIYTAGAAAGLLAEAVATTAEAAAAASATFATVGTTMAAGATALAGSSGLIGLAAAAIGGAVGSIASQAVGDLMGNTHGFSWKQVATSSIGAVVTAGVGWGMSTAFPTAAAAGTASYEGLSTGEALRQGAESFAYNVGTAVGSSAVQQALKGEWSWRQVAASAVGSAAGQAAGAAMSSVMGNMAGASLASKFAARMAGGWANSEVMATDPRYTKAKLGALFADSLGGAIGDTIVEAIEASGRPGKGKALDGKQMQLQALDQLAANRNLTDDQQANIAELRAEVEAGQHSLNIVSKDDLTDAKGVKANARFRGDSGTIEVNSALLNSAGTPAGAAVLLGALLEEHGEWAAHATGVQIKTDKGASVDTGAVLGLEAMAKLGSALDAAGQPNLDFSVNVGGASRSFTTDGLDIYRASVSLFTPDRILMNDHDAGGAYQSTAFSDAAHRVFAKLRADASELGNQASTVGGFVFGVGEQAVDMAKGLSQLADDARNSTAYLMLKLAHVDNDFIPQGLSDSYGRMEGLVAAASNFVKLPVSSMLSKIFLDPVTKTWDAANAAYSKADATTGFEPGAWFDYGRALGAFSVNMAMAVTGAGGLVKAGYSLARLAAGGLESAMTKIAGGLGEAEQLATSTTGNVVIFGREFQVMHIFNKGGVLAKTGGQIWNVPDGMTLMDIPVADATGDALQAAVDVVEPKYARAKLPEGEQDYLRRLEAAGDPAAVAKQEKMYKGTWVQNETERYLDANAPALAEDLTFSRPGQPVIDVRTSGNLSYDVHTDKLSTILDHCYKYPSQLWRAITYPSRFGQ